MEAFVMKRQLFVPFMIMIVVFNLFTGCGGKSSDSPAAAPTKVVVKFSTEGTLASGIGIGTIKITASLPAGLSVKGAPNTLNPAEIDIDTSSVTITGVAASKVVLTRAAYTPASNTILIDMYCPALTGLPVGEFATVQCDIATDTSPDEKSIQITSTQIRDNNVQPLSGITVTYSASKQ
jgi:hypothetical protein